MLLDVLQEKNESLLSELHPWIENNVIGKDLSSTHDLAINSAKGEINLCRVISLISSCFVSMFQSFKALIYWYICDFFMRAGRLHSEFKSNDN